MEIVLLQNIRKLGKIGEIVTVADGYARNYLIRFSMAMRATKANIAEVEARKQDIKKAQEKLHTEAKKCAKKCEDLSLIFVCNASEDGRLYGSISKKDIVTRIAGKIDTKINTHNLVINNPIKTTGVHNIGLSLHSDMDDINVTICVAKHQSEAESMLKEFLSGKEKATPELEATA